MDKRERVDLFDRWAERYDGSVREATGVFDGYDEVLNQVVLDAGVQPAMRVLDLGVGTGNLAQRFVALGCVVWGADFAAAMLDRARVQVPQVILIQMDLRDKVWPGELGQRFDRIVSTYVLHEFDLATKIGLLDRLARHQLAARGRIVVGDIAFQNIEALRQAGADHWDEQEHYWAADETVEACKRVGLRVTYKQVSSCGGVFAIEPN